MRETMMRRTGLCAALALCMAAAGSPATTGPTNLLKDTKFENVGDGNEGWASQTTDDAEVTASKDATGLNGHSALLIKVDKVTSTDWNAQVYQAGLTLAKGGKYDLTFTAKASAARKINVFLQLSSDPYTPLTEMEKVDLTTDAKPQTVKFTVNADTTEGKLTLAVGQATGTVTISDLSLVKTN